MQNVRHDGRVKVRELAVATRSASKDAKATAPNTILMLGASIQAYLNKAEDAVSEYNTALQHLICTKTHSLAVAATS